MNKKVLPGLAIGMFLMITGGAANALTMADVGPVDTLKAWAVVNSGRCQRAGMGE